MTVSKQTTTTNGEFEKFFKNLKQVSDENSCSYRAQQEQHCE